MWPEKAKAKASNYFSPDSSEEQTPEFPEPVMLLKKGKEERGGKRRKARQQLVGLEHLLSFSELALEGLNKAIIGSALSCRFPRKQD